jgi:large subunit ribosomal protein L2
MALRASKATTPGQRQLIQIDRSSLWKGRPLKSLTSSVSRKSGHNNQGRITFWHRGGGHKRLYRLVDFKRDKLDMPGEIIRLEYDPNRSAFIALVQYKDGENRYILAPQGVKPGSIVEASAEKVDIRPGNAMPLKSIPVGTMVHNVEMKAGKGGQMARSAGASIQIMGRDAGNIILKLTSGEVRLVKAECFATVGVLANSDHQNRSYGKAGRMRWLGWRPHVRGVAMNPVDHPHGGGEGRTSGGRHPVTPWGLGTKGKKTRKNKRTSPLIIKKRK